MTIEEVRAIAKEEYLRACARFGARVLAAEGAERGSTEMKTEHMWAWEAEIRQLLMGQAIWLRSGMPELGDEAAHAAGCAALQFERDMLELR